MKNKDEALKMAIEALEQSEKQLKKYWNEDIKRGYDIEEMNESPIILCEDTIQACKEALAHPAQEPVAWIEVTTHHEKYQTSKVVLLDKGIKLPHDTLLYTHPAPSWQGLTSEEIRSLDLDNDVISVIFQTEKLLKEKNDKG